MNFGLKKQFRKIEIELIIVQNIIRDFEKQIRIKRNKILKLNDL